MYCHTKAYLFNHWPYHDLILTFIFTLETDACLFLPLINQFNTYCMSYCYFMSESPFPVIALCCVTVT